MELHELKLLLRWRMLWITTWSEVHQHITHSLLKWTFVVFSIMKCGHFHSRCDPQHSTPERNHHPPSLYLWWHQHQLPARGLSGWLQGSPAGGGQTQGAVGFSSSSLHHCSAPLTEGPGQPEVRTPAAMISVGSYRSLDRWMVVEAAGDCLFIFTIWLYYTIRVHHNSFCSSEWWWIMLSGRLMRVLLLSIFVIYQLETTNMQASLSTFKWHCCNNHLELYSQLCSWAGQLIKK